MIPPLCSCAWRSSIQVDLRASEGLDSVCARGCRNRKKRSQLIFFGGGWGWGEGNGVEGGFMQDHYLWWLFSIAPPPLGLHQQFQISIGFIELNNGSESKPGCRGEANVRSAPLGPDRRSLSVWSRWQGWGGESIHVTMEMGRSNMWLGHYLFDLLGVFLSPSYNRNIH